MEASHSQDLRRIFEKLETISADVSGLRGDFRVHVAEDRALAEEVSWQGKKIDDFERAKNKGMLLIILGWLAAGGMGGGAAHIARKWLE